MARPEGAGPVMTAKLREQIAMGLALVLSIFAMGLFFWRLRRGIDFTDEAFHLGLPLRFALGDRPFVDELNVAQTAGLLVYPLVKLHVLVRGTTGIFWFIRIVYGLFFMAVGACAYGLARTKLPRHASVLAGVACVPFIPYSAPSLGYNAVGCGLLAIGLFTTTRGVLTRGDTPKPWRDPLCWGGFFLGAAAFAYPTLVVCVVAMPVLVYLSARAERPRAALHVVIGGAAFGLVVAPAFLRAGSHGVREVLAYSGATAVAAAEGKFPILWREFISQHPELTTTFGAVAVAVALSRFFPRTVALFLPFVPFLANETTGKQGYMASLGFVASLALLAPFFGLALKDIRFGATVLACAWLPSAGAGAMVAWTSSNRSVAAGVGLYPAAIISVVLLTTWIFELVRTLPFDVPRLVFGFAPLVPLSVMLKLALLNDAIYRDATIPELTAKITEGPYKDLLTTPTRRNDLHKTSETITALAKTEHTLFYYDFPAGYLITKTRPLVGSAWIFPLGARMAMDAKIFSERAKPGDTVFFLGGTLNPAVPLDHAVANITSPLGRHDGFNVFVVK